MYNTSLLVIRDDAIVNKKLITTEGECDLHTLIFSDTFFKEVQRPYMMFCAISFSSVSIELGCNVCADDIAYTISRLRQLDFLPEPPDSVLNKHNCITIRHNSFDDEAKTVVFSKNSENNNNNYKTHIPNREDFQRFFEDLQDLIFDPNEPISNFNLTYKEI